MHNAPRASRDLSLPIVEWKQINLKKTGPVVNLRCKLVGSAKELTSGAYSSDTHISRHGEQLCFHCTGHQAATCSLAYSCISSRVSVEPHTNVGTCAAVVAWKSVQEFQPKKKIMNPCLNQQHGQQHVKFCNCMGNILPKWWP